MWYCFCSRVQVHEEYMNAVLGLTPDNRWVSCKDSSYKKSKSKKYKIKMRINVYNTTLRETAHDGLNLDKTPKWDSNYISLVKNN